MTTVFLLNVKAAVKDVYLLFWSVALPVGALITMGIFFDGYVEYTLVGMSAVSLLFYAFMSTSFTSLSQRRRGVYDLLHATPMPLYQYILSVSGARSMISMVLGYMILVVSWIFYSPSFSIIGLLMTFPVLLIGSTAFIFLSFAVSSVVKTEGHLSMSTNLIMLPMVLCSSAFYSLENAPSFIQYVSMVNPFEWLVTGIRTSMTVEMTLWIQNVFILFVFFALFFILSLRTFKYERH
ncbi:ABC transporter permease [Salicibibacter cibi]|uniref:Transport permease protein n=1 Tax=Salicibibacter cibi TaxID=2743001 RepID=A0A7T6ZAU6_9BACI|nr:ABC transporter permease [Salicibibacter cibi]QQK80070.1 ABC transporter permease [Salicibibacter cibi]